MEEILGGHESVWVATTQGTGYPHLSGHVNVDVVVLGGGLTGLQTAYMLKKAGMRVAVVEARSIGQAVSGQTTAKIEALQGLAYKPLIDELGREAAVIYADANQVALQTMAALIVNEGIECGFERQTATTYAETPKETDAVEKEVVAAQQAGLDATYVDTLPLPFAVYGAVSLAGQACFHPRQYMLHLAATIDGDGSMVYEHSRITGLDEKSMTVACDTGMVTAQYIVLATHFPVFDRSTLSVRVKPGASYLLAAKLDGFVPEGMHISAAQKFHSLRPLRVDGQEYLLIGGQPHRLGEGGDTRRQYAALEQWARRTFPVTEISYSWSTHDLTTVDRVPFIGRFGGNERIWTATGFKGWGMTNSMVAALIIHDGILGHDNAWAGLYDPRRLHVRASAVPFISQGLDSAKHLVADRVFKRDQPACTHMGCIVQRNTAEDTWDCPCHGSRFLAHGEVLRGPALAPLELKKQSPG